MAATWAGADGGDLSGCHDGEWCKPDLVLLPLRRPRSVSGAASISGQRDARRGRARLPSSSSVVAASAPLPTLLHSPTASSGAAVPRLLSGRRRVVGTAAGPAQQLRAARRRIGQAQAASSPPPLGPACGPLPLLRTTPSRDGSTSVKDRLLTNQSSVVNKYTIMRSMSKRRLIQLWQEPGEAETCIAIFKSARNSCSNRFGQ
ncbi:unnamed protein product [Urochloa humidicola]